MVAILDLISIQTAMFYEILYSQPVSPIRKLWWPYLISYN